MTVMITDTNKDFNKWIKIALRDSKKNIGVKLKKRSLF